MVYKVIPIAVKPATIDIIVIGNGFSLNWRNLYPNSFTTSKNKTGNSIKNKTE